MRRHVFAAKMDEDVPGCPWHGSPSFSSGVQAALEGLGLTGDDLRFSFKVTATELVLQVRADVPAGTFQAAYTAWDPVGHARNELTIGNINIIDNNTEEQVYRFATFDFDDGNGVESYGLQLENHRKLMSLAILALMTDVTQGAWVTPPPWPSRGGYSLVLDSTAKVYGFFLAAMTGATAIEAAANAEIAAVHAMVTNAELRAWTDSRL